MRAALLACVLAATVPAVARAQTYPSASPVPRSTAVPVLRALAIRREITTRFALALRDQAAGHWSDAAAELQAVLALAPPEPQGSTAHYDLALAYAHLDRNAAAARELQRAIALDPGFLAAMANLVAIDLARGDLRTARAAADRFVAAAPGSARALYSRGIVALRLGDAATARADFGKLLQQSPRYALAHYDLALAEEHLGAYASAASELSIALALAPSYARARLALGVIYLREGHRAQARAAFLRAAHDAAGDPALRNLADAMLAAI